MSDGDFRRQSPTCLGAASVAPALAFLLPLLHPQVHSLAEPTWEVMQLTNGDVFDSQPDVNGRTYVWQRQRHPGRSDVLIWTEGDEVPAVISSNNRAFVQPHPRFKLVASKQEWHGRCVSPYLNDTR